MPPLNAAPFSKNVNPTIYNVFPELNQGKQYLQKQTEVKKKLTKRTTSLNHSHLITLGDS